MIYNVQTDPNQLLGRPGQYIGKASWQDTRLQSAQPIAGNYDCGVETFADTQTLRVRTAYVTAITRGSSLFAEYDYWSQQGLFLLRLSHKLTPDQAKDYVTALQKTYKDLQEPPQSLASPG